MSSKRFSNQRNQKKIIYVAKPLQEEETKQEKLEESEIKQITNPKFSEEKKEEKKIENDLPIKKEEKSLTKNLIQQFKYRKVECPICYNKIHNEARLWSCRQCFQSYHLNCISKWITNSNTNKNSNFSLYKWSCPKCCYLYTEEMPDYFCFCGKTSNPEYDSYALPHSCSETCGKKSKCPHSCTMKCHPGPCPPCTLVEKKVTCFCGKKFFMTKCNDDMTNFPCNNICDKKLNCQKHFCSKPCHPGSCPPCEEELESSCFCSKTKKLVKCGFEKFSCEEVCSKELDCLNHKCNLICHNSICPSCPLKPSLVNTCPCGKASLTLLQGPNSRKSCLDPIAICGLPCGKLLACKTHYCKEMCHLKPECGLCKELVEQNCRCGKKKRKIECWIANKEIYLCEKICKKKKSCAVHGCNEVCCPANSKDDILGNHLCLKICGKKLTCGQHTCDLFCHLGYCKPCPILINVPITCTCQKTILNPPLPCGTKPPSCNLPCSRVKPCNHPCLWECHEDSCPPCDYLVDKKCNCQRYIMKNVSCSKEVSCGENCDVELKCGHLCGIICHKGVCPGNQEDFVCKQKCPKIREDCSHKCLSLCHGLETCPKNFCKVLKKVTCACGNRFGFTECGNLMNKIIKCDVSCKSKNRFGNLSDLDSKKYSAGLIKFARSEFSFLLKLEEKIEKLIKNPNSPAIEQSIKGFNSTKIWYLQTLIVFHYQLDMELYLHLEIPLIMISSNKNMKNPRTKLSSYLKNIENGAQKPNDISPFDVTIKFYHPNMKTFSNEIEFIIKEAKVDYLIEDSEKNMTIFLWDLEDAEFVAKKLKKKNYSNFQYEKNLKIKSEEEKFIHVLEDLIDKDEVINNDPREESKI